MEWLVSNFHKSSIQSGFAPSMFINFTDGVPTAEAMNDEITRLYADKFFLEDELARHIKSYEQHNSRIAELEGKLGNEK